MTKRRPRRCVHCYAPVRFSNGQYFHAIVPEWLGTIARETQPIPKSKVESVNTKDKT